MSASTKAVRRYLKALASGNLDGMVACFTADAVIVSPVYGTVSVRPFYEKLHADTISAEVEIRTIYVAEDRADRVIAHFAYRWERYSAPRSTRMCSTCSTSHPTGSRSSVSVSS